ncbi:MAG: hypothetical protein AB7U82_02850 [Blastocatellales bacterium]
MNELKWNEISFSLTDVAVVGALRFASGFGLGLLLTDSISERLRNRLGWSIFLGSIAVGIPLGIRMLRGDREAEDYIPARHNGHEQPVADQVVF